MSLFIHIVLWALGIVAWLAVGIFVMVKIVLPILDQLIPEPHRYADEKEPTDAQLGGIVLLLLVCACVWPAFLAIVVVCLIFRGIATVLGKAARKFGL